VTVDIADAEPLGNVVRQEPAPGTIAPEGSTVTVYISTGP
jgi:beta-lactam-binding protein with PASTA domain